jgi:hypothetical protein
VRGATAEAIQEIVALTSTDNISASLSDDSITSRCNSGRILLQASEDTTTDSVDGKYRVTHPRQ